MQVSLREKLRHDVRALVHQACWRRFEGDDAGADAFLDSELTRLLTTAADTAPAEEVVRNWLEEDRGDFDRGLVIGELVARRVASATASAPLASAPAQPTRVTAPAVTRSRRPNAPQIADLLDDMLEQDRRGGARG